MRRSVPGDSGGWISRPGIKYIAALTVVLGVFVVAPRIWKSESQLERDSAASRCASKEGCPYRDPKSHASWVSFSSSPYGSIEKLPTLGKVDIPATSGRLLLFGIVAADTSVVMMDHLLRHYIELGVQPKHLLLVLSDEKGILTSSSPLLEVLRARGLPGYYLWTGLWSNSNMAIVRERILSELRDGDLLRNEDWILELDADELQVYPSGWDSLPAFLSACEAKGINAIFGVWRDRVATDGALNKVTPPEEASIFAQFPVMCNLRTVGKIMVRRAVLAVSDGKHKVVGIRGAKHTKVVYLRQVLPVMHFKWVDGAVERLQHKVVQAEGQGRVDHRSIDILDHIKENRGTLDISLFLNHSVCCLPEDPRNVGLPCDPEELQSYRKWGYHDAKAPWLDGAKSEPLEPPAK